MNKKNLLLLCFSLMMTFMISSCKNDKGRSQTVNSNEQTIDSCSEAKSPFSSDSAYFFIEKQLAFGPRVPNTAGHEKCRQWIVSKLQDYGAKVTQQEAQVTAHDGKVLNMTNIIGSYNPDASHRVLLLAHWDTRPVADQEQNPSLKMEPIPGADDGGSGVGILLELARLLHENNLSVGVDLLFVDAEDYGVENNEESWCLGSTYWSQHPHTANYKADFGILLDMVGARRAEFRWEYFSKNHAPQVLSLVWQTAQDLGFGQYFIQSDGSALTDDHVPIIRHMGIPTIDIVNFSPSNAKGFGDHWHTMNDNIQVIDKSVLHAVGATLYEVLRSL